MPAPPGSKSGAGATADVALPMSARSGVALEESGAPLWAIVFAGGIGSRFWPLASPERPKPLLALVTGQPLLADTIGRLQPDIPPDRVLVLTSRDIAPAIRSIVTGVPEQNILVEPRPLGTAAALAWGAQEVIRRAGPDALCVAMHADLAVGFPDALRLTLRRAAALTQREQALVAVGIRATRAEPAFGWLHLDGALDAAAPVAAGGAAIVRQFVEKPSETDAVQALAAGAYWHGGIVVAAAGELLRALDAHCVEIRPGLDALRDGNLPTFVGMIRATSIERGLLERLPRLLALPGDFGWDDVGTWASLRRARELDDDGNGAHGPVHFVDSESNIVHTERGTVVLYGTHRMLVVALPGLTFVTPLDRATDLKPLLDALPGSLRINPGGAK
ncbi:MAG: hypothetical protein K2X99_12330 [Gemmatimonadaceae bacterium]|nr:hypothetical protein [Gemmatimonadaceae bacterium]